MATSTCQVNKISENKQAVYFQGLLCQIYTKIYNLIEIFTNIPVNSYSFRCLDAHHFGRVLNLKKYMVHIDTILIYLKVVKHVLKCFSLGL